MEQMVLVGRIVTFAIYLTRPMERNYVLPMVLKSLVRMR